MKKFIIAALAASIVATPVMAAPYPAQRQSWFVQNHRVDHRNDYRQVQYRAKWNKAIGSTIARPATTASSPTIASITCARRRAAIRWVQSGNDAILIGITSGIVASVLAGAFH